MLNFWGHNVPILFSLQKLVAEGPSAFYTGSVARSIVEALSAVGGLMTLSDLQAHMNCSEKIIRPSISATYRSTTVHTPGLPCQGAILLRALNILEEFDISGLGSKSAEFQHLIIEAMRVALVDGLSTISDPEFSSIDDMISKDHAKKKRAPIDINRAMESCATKGLPCLTHSGTVAMAAIDPDGNGCSFLSSIGVPFGCTIVQEHGFAMQVSVGARTGCTSCSTRYLCPVLFGKVVCHTWVYAMHIRCAFSDFSKIQVVLNLVDHELDPQEAVTRARAKIGSIQTTHPE
ncbi:unnamed protein product [Ixodes hexagonus]